MVWLYAIASQPNFWTSFHKFHQGALLRFSIALQIMDAASKNLINFYDNDKEKKVTFCTASLNSSATFIFLYWLHLLFKLVKHILLWYLIFFNKKQQSRMIFLTKNSNSCPATSSFQTSFALPRSGRLFPKFRKLKLIESVNWTFRIP